MNTQSSRSLAWLSIVCFALVAAIVVARVFQQGIGDGTLTGLLLGAVFVSGVFAYFDIRDFLRFRAVSATHPLFFVSHVVIYTEFVSQLNMLAETVAPGALRSRSGRHGTIAVNATTFAVFGGSAKPKALFATSELRLRDVRIARSQQGLWKLQCLELEYETGDRTVVIDVPLLQIRLGIPRVVSKKRLEQMLPEVTRLLAVRN